MRRLTTFACAGETLAASLDEADGAIGVLLATGGSQTRIGSHRIYEQLAKALATNGYPCWRYDRRGVGDSAGGDPGFRGSGPDIAAAAGAFRTAAQVEQIIGIGLCDGGTALALFGAAAGLSGIILINPWLVEAESSEPPAAAVRRHYRARLSSFAGWRRLLSGSVSYRKLWRGLVRIAAPPRSTLAAEVAGALRMGPPAALILAREDATAVAAEVEWNAPRFKGVRDDPIYVESDSHTFARPGDAEAVVAACLEAIGRLTKGLRSLGSKEAS